MADPLLSLPFFVFGKFKELYGGYVLNENAYCVALRGLVDGNIVVHNIFGRNNVGNVYHWGD
jgi:hypothetical protein